MLIKYSKPISLATAMLLFSIAPSSFAAWGWEPVESADLEKITHNMTWTGDGWVIYWKDDNTRVLETDSDTFNETWSIEKDGKEICSDHLTRGRRCGVIEVKKKKYRSTRTDGPAKGKRFVFKVIEGR